ncbi:MAG TPA: regulatory iron-sulfur-containing complex subunit RicT [Candidatus Bipolaricaulota bacterium]|nr:regulatory iron-sulfur-containing complex subunit RicT [Candidatus Bipolaricaulota bacterium]
MKKVVSIQFNSWDKTYFFDPNNIELKIDDYVVVETQHGLDMGKVVEFKELGREEQDALGEIKSVLRKADKRDLDKLIENKEKVKEAIKVCKELIKKHGLPIKLVDVHLNLDGGRITFAFIADSRVDFRALLKDLNRLYKMNIRLQQLGIRDEAQIAADVGCCGQPVCCKTFLKELGNVSSEYADLQQVSHRGSERLSGLCGRLKCCLAYEKDTYEEMARDFPALGAKVKVKQGTGEVVGYHVLRRSVDVRLDGDGANVYVEAPISEISQSIPEKTKQIIKK